MKSRANQLKLQGKDSKNMKCHYIFVANFTLNIRAIEYDSNFV